MLRTWYVRLVLILCLVGSAGAARAAPPVTPLAQAPVTTHYDEAARALHFPEWGETQRNEQCVHVVVRLTVRDALIGISLPPSVPPVQADRWLQELADTMQWDSVVLSSARGPGGSFLSTKVLRIARPGGFGKQRVQLDLPRLRAALRTLTPLPVQLGVRSSAREMTSSPAAAAQGSVQRVGYAFYREADLTGTPLVVTYGMDRRWRLALIAAWCAWALFPSFVFLGLRAHLRRDAARSPKERWEVYQRWTNPVWLTTVSGAIVTPFLLSFRGVPYLLSPFVKQTMAFLFVVLVVPSSWVLLPASLIGFPLSRELSEKLRKRRFRDLLVLQLILLSLIHAAVPVMLWLQRLPSGKPADPFPWWQKFPLGALFLFPIPALLFGWLASWRRSRRRALEVPPGEALADPELTEQVRQLTTWLGTPITRVLLVPEGDAERQRGAAVNGQLATLLRSMAEALTPQQAAALVGAEALATPNSWQERLPGALGMLLGGAGMLSIAWMIFSSTTNSYQPSPLQIALVAGVPLASLPLLIDGQLGRRRQDQADLAIAGALEDPALFVEALCALEAARMEATNLDPELVPIPKRLTARRRRLERRLGLE